MHEISIQNPAENGQTVSESVGIQIKWGFYLLEITEVQFTELTFSETNMLLCVHRIINTEIFLPFVDQ